MKRLIAISLVLTLLFSVAACGNAPARDGGSETESASTAPAPSSSPEAAPTSSTEQSDSAEEIDASGDDVESAPVQMVPVVEPPLESHEGDAEYFYVTSDDYFVAISMVETEDHEDIVETYVAFSFEDGICTNVCVKEVYEDAATAQRNENADAIAVIDNVAYYPQGVSPYNIVASFNWLGATRDELAEYEDGEI